MYPYFKETGIPFTTYTLKHPDDEGRSFTEMSAYFYRITGRRTPGDGNPLAPVNEKFLQHVGREKTMYTITYIRNNSSM